MKKEKVYDWKNEVVVILFMILLDLAVYANNKLFPPDSIWSFQYWFDIIK